MNAESLARLDTALACGQMSRMGYVVAVMHLAEEDADRIIKDTPEAQPARLLLQVDQQRDLRPKLHGRRPHPFD